MSNITNIPAPRTEFIDSRTGLISRDWYRFLLNLFTIAGSGTSSLAITDLAVAPVSPQAAGQFDPSDIGSPAVVQSSPFQIGATLRQKRTAITINSAATDVATFTGLPAKYVVTAFRVFDASTSLAASAATLGLYTASGGGGSNLATLSTLTALSVTSTVLSLPVPTVNGLTNSFTYQTGSTLYVRNGTAHGSAATVSVQLEILDLS